MHLKLDARDWEYLSGKKQYIYVLPHTGEDALVEDEEVEIRPHDCLVSLKISADAFVEVYLENSLNEELHPLWSGTQVNLSFQTCGFNSIHLRAEAKTKIAIQTLKKIKGEQLDPTPMTVSMGSEKDIPLKEAIRRALQEELNFRGFENLTADDFDLNPFDGDFDDLLEEEGLSDYQVAEMDEQIAARKAAEDDQSEDDESDPPDDDDQSEVVTDDTEENP